MLLGNPHQVRSLQTTAGNLGHILTRALRKASGVKSVNMMKTYTIESSTTAHWPQWELIIWEHKTIIFSQIKSLLRAHQNCITWIYAQLHFLIPMRFTRTPAWLHPQITWPHIFCQLILALKTNYMLICLLWDIDKIPPHKSCFKTRPNVSSVFLIPFCHPRWQPYWNLIC